MAAVLASDKLPTTVGKRDNGLEQFKHKIGGRGAAIGICVVVGIIVIAVAVGFIATANQAVKNSPLVQAVNIAP